MRSDDEKLVSQTLAGDRDAFGVLVHKYQDMVYAYAFQKVRNAEDAQDVTQEVFWRAYHSLYQLRQPHRFRSWLYTIMSNECKRRLVSAAKIRQRETTLEDATDDALRIEPAHTTPTESWRVDLEQALTELPDDNRVAVSMFYMGDHSLKEISEFLGVSVNTVKGKLYRARQQLGNALSERYGRLLESHKLKGGFLMQFMEQIHHIPSPTMASSWSSAAVGKILFSLIVAVCVLIGIAIHGTDSPTALSMNRVGMGPTEVVLLAPITDATGSFIPASPVETENHPRAASSRASGDQGRQLAARGTEPGDGGSAQRPAAVSGQFFIEGRVTDTSGVPVRGARVLTQHSSELVYVYLWKALYMGTQVLTQQSSEHWETSTDKNGDYRLENLPMAVLIELKVSHPEYAHHKFKILKTNQRHDLVLVKADGYVAGKVVDADGKPIEQARVGVEAEEESGYVYSGVSTNLQGEFELKHIKAPIVSIIVSHDRNYKMFKDIAVNQRDLVLTLTPRPGLTPEQRAEWEARRTYFEATEERVKTLVNQPAPELTAAEWLSGSPTSIGDLKGKTVALHFWHSKSLNVDPVRLLDTLQEIYQEKGLVCITICPTTTAVETVKQHIAEQSLSHSIALDQPTTVVGADGETFDRYAISWSSQIVLINAAGQITGHIWDHELESKIQVLLAD